MTAMIEARAIQGMFRSIEGGMFSKAGQRNATGDVVHWGAFQPSSPGAQRQAQLTILYTTIYEHND